MNIKLTDKQVESMLQLEYEFSIITQNPNNWRKVELSDGVYVKSMIYRGSAVALEKKGLLVSSGMKYEWRFTQAGIDWLKTYPQPRPYKNPFA